jgi:hypothetical protein
MARRALLARRVLLVRRKFSTRRLLLFPRLRKLLVMATILKARKGGSSNIQMTGERDTPTYTPQCCAY